MKSGELNLTSKTIAAWANMLVPLSFVETNHTMRRGNKSILTDIARKGKFPGVSYT